jgi:acyl carrier protein
MKKDELLTKVTDIFRDTLENDDIVLTYDTKASDVEEWDSLNHIMLVVAVEKEFGIRFNSQEIQEWNNVGDMLDCILTKKP